MDGLEQIRSMVGHLQSKVLRLLSFAHWRKPDSVDALPVSNEGSADWLYATDTGQSTGSALTVDSFQIHRKGGGFDNLYGDSGKQYLVDFDGGGVITLSQYTAPVDVEASTGINDMLVGDGGGAWDQQTFTFGVLYNNGNGFDSANGDGLVHVVSGVSVTVSKAALETSIISSVQTSGNFLVTAGAGGSLSLTSYSPPSVPNIEAGSAGYILEGGSDGGWDKLTGDGLVQVVSGSSVTIAKASLENYIISSVETSGDFLVTAGAGGALSLTALGTSIVDALVALPGSSGSLRYNGGSPEWY